MSYKFNEATITKNWSSTNFGSDESSIFFGDNALIPEFGFGMNGDNTFSLFINTSAVDESGTFSRISPWRKAYRILNRFDVGNINVDRRDNNKESQGIYRSKRSSVIDNQQRFETPLSHKSPCRFPRSSASNINGSRPLIELVYSLTPRAITDPSGEWGGSIDGSDPEAEWSIGSGGLRFIQNTTPDSIEFSVLKTGSELIKVDTNSSMIPAYSGEILEFQDGEGFGYVGTENNLTKIFINITQTDEILRWDSEEDPDRNPHEFWKNTFSSIQLKNYTKTSLPAITFAKSTMEVVSNDKDNYIVSFTSASTIPYSRWTNDDVIRIRFNRKKTIVYGDERAPWESAKYNSIRYRSLDEEFNDDPFITSPVDPPDGGTESSEIQPFTLSLDGNLGDGSIIVNYPSGFDATGITFEVYIETD